MIAIDNHQQPPLQQPQRGFAAAKNRLLLCSFLCAAAAVSFFSALFLIKEQPSKQPDLEPNSSNSISFNAKRLLLTKNPAFTRWKTHGAGRTPEIVLSEEDTKKWEACRQVFSRFQFTTEEEDKILGKAFGLVHSPYWGEEREKNVPEYESIDAIIEYLTGLGLSDDDVIKILKKFPEVVGCSLENELKTNVQILEKQWGIKGKSLRNLLLRNPKVLGYIIDCKGDCMALCTRCWVRF